MNSLQENILDAVKMLADNSVNHSNATLTIECRIVEILDAGINLYKVNYRNNDFEAYASNALDFEVDDIVFVLIPDGDFSKTKTIIGAVEPVSRMSSGETESDTYIKVSNSLLGEIDEIQLCTYNDEIKVINIDEDFNTIFKDYFNNYKNYLFSARIRTDMPLEQQINGNYGIILNLPVWEDAGDGSGEVQTWKAFSIDVNTIQGNPYKLNEYALQNIYINLDEGLRYDDSQQPYMIAFVQDFMQNETQTAADIFIKDISFTPVEALPAAALTGYYLSLVASEGNYFLDSKYAKSKVLTPILKVNGKDKKVNDYDCYWFVEDASITTTSDGYYPIGGLGWKCLNSKTNVHFNEDGKQIYEYVTNEYTYQVSDDDVTSILKYKCVLVKNDVYVSGIVTLKNLISNIQTQLVSATGFTSFVKNTGYINLIARITGQAESDLISTAWQRFDKDGQYLDNDFYEVVRRNDPVEIADGTGIVRTWLETEITYPCSFLEKSNLINCTFYRSIRKNGIAVQQNLGSESILLSTTDNENYRIFVENGDVLYKYDADGDSPMIADYDGPESSRVKEIRPIRFRVYKADGTELTENEYRYCKTTWSVPKESMIKLKNTVTSEDDTYYYVSGQGQISINYSILDTYNVKKSNNTILLNIEFDGNNLNDSINLKFLKDGESGTNGSKYAAVITYNDYAYGELGPDGAVQKLQLIYVNGDGWYYADGGELKAWTPRPLGISVYCDGSKISSSYSITWSMFDSTITNPVVTASGGNVNIINGKTWTGGDSSSIVEARVTVGNSGQTNSQETIYAYYPLEITYLSNSNLKSGVIPNLAGGFDKVLYAADGTNPRYDNSNPFEFASNLKEVEGSEYYNYIWDSSDNFTLSANQSSCEARPVTKFDNGKSQNFIRVRMNIPQATLNNISQRIVELSQDLQEANSLNEYYLNVVQHLVDFYQNFEYNNYKEVLKESKEFLNYRSQLINYINDIFNILLELKNYCINKNIKINIFDYNTVYNTLYTIMVSQQAMLYDAGWGSNLDDLTPLTCDIVYEKEAEYKAEYGISSYEVFISIVNRYNTLLNQYNNVNSILTEKVNNQYVYQNQFNSYKNFVDAMRETASNEDLTWVAAHAEDFDEDKLIEFINLKEQIEELVSRLRYEPVSYTYSSIVENVLDKINELVQSYTDSVYRNIYVNKASQKQVEINNLQVAIRDYTKLVTASVTDYIIHSKPIVMIYNRYELSNINGWDGNKLYIDEQNQEYLLAPQVGAGLKKNGLFTGIVMGVKQFNNSVNQNIGLFGYSSGLQSIFLNAEDGSATFGKAGGGQIYIQPSSNTAIIKSGNYSTTNKTGMQIDFTTPEIRFGSGDFIVNSSGHLTAKGGGSIGGWSINNTTLTGGNTTLNSNGTITCANLQANTAGKIGGWTIGGSTLTGGNTTLNSNGTITCSDLQANSSGSIGGWSISSSTLSGGGTTLNSNGTITCSKIIADSSGSIGGWSITADGLQGGNTILYKGGTIYCVNLSASVAGYIGGWAISSTGLSGGSMSIKSEGSMSGPTWSITSGGVATFNKVNITGGSASPSGSGSTLNWGGNFKVDANGNMTCANANVKGTVTSSNGTIGGWSISSNGFQNGGAKLFNDGTFILIRNGEGINIGDRLATLTQTVEQLKSDIQNKANKGTYTGSISVANQSCSITI